MKGDAHITATIINVQRRARPLLEHDRREFLDTLAVKADRAMANADFRTSYGILRALSGSSHRESPALKKLDGTYTADAAEITER